MGLPAVFLVSAFFAASLSAQAPRFVLPRDGLNLRTEPNGPVLITIPYGSAVTILGAPGSDFQTSGYSGKWQRVKYQNREGFAFDAFLSSLPVPAANCSSIAQYVANQLHVTNRTQYYFLSRWNATMQTAEEIKRSPTPISDFDGMKEVPVFRRESRTREGVLLQEDKSDEVFTETLSSQTLPAQYLYLLTLACLDPLTRTAFADFSVFTPKRSRVCKPANPELGGIGPSATIAVTQKGTVASVSYTHTALSCP